MNKNSLIILSIDPGYDRCGWAIGVKENGEYKNLDFGLIQTQKTHSIFERFAEVSNF
ncbi:crossover junction endodeoxyribonuclease RuvC, partial [Patescibacteria group bacterium]|nr:crossover junction endodeoxyribonuclease RuvC [Patescibacteria group bacterium]